MSRMNKNRFLTPVTIALVSSAHLAIIMATWQTVKPDSPLVEDLMVVGLEAFSGAGHSSGGAAEEQKSVPVAPAKPVQPEVQRETHQPKVKPTPKKIQPTAVEPSKVSTVNRQDKPADVFEQPKIRQPENTVKPVESSSEKSSTKPENNQVSQSALSQAVSSDGQGQAAAHDQGGAKGATGVGKGTGNGHGQGGGSSMAGANEIVDGGYISPPNIVYPARAKENDEQGVVQIEFIVEPDGRVSSLKVLKSSGSRILDSAASKGIRATRFRAKMVNGVAVRTRLKTKVNFSLS